MNSDSFNKCSSSFAKSPHPFLAGLHFAVLQGALFFALCLWYSSSAAVYLLLVGAWLLGSALGARTGIKTSSPILTMFAASTIGYVACVLTVNHIWPQLWVAMIYGVLGALVSGFQVGNFFSRMEGVKLAANALWHENNGFVIGLVLSSILFLKFGVRFVILAPLVSLAICIGSTFVSVHYILAFLAAAVIISGDSAEIILALIAYLISWVNVLDCTKCNAISADESDSKSSSARYSTSLFLCGIVTLLLQVIVVRKFAILFSACELTMMIGAAVYMLSYSAAFYFGGQLSRKWIRRAVPALFILQIVLLMGCEFLFTAEIFRSLGVVLVFGAILLTIFAGASVYVWILPDSVRRGGFSLSLAYALEGFGALVGCLLLFVSLNVDKLNLISLVVVLGCAAIFASGLVRVFSLNGLLMSCSAIVSVLIGGNVGEKALGSYYKSLGFKDAKVLYSHNNYYHRIDVIESKEGARQAFLNGVRYFGSDSLRDFTYYLAELPARTSRMPKVLILGAGSMLSVNRLLPIAEMVTMIEIDAEVPDVSRKYFPQFHEEEIRFANRFKFVAEDARLWFRANTTKFDLIVFDISAPYYLQTAALHTVEFLELAKQHLEPTGVFSIATSGTPRASHELTRRLVETVRSVFPRFILASVPKIGNGFIYAGTQLPFTEKMVSQAYQSGPNFDERTAFYESEMLPFSTRRDEPLSLSNLSIILTSNLKRIKNRMRLN